MFRRNRQEKLSIDKAEMKTDKKVKKESEIRNPETQIHVGCQGWNYDDWTTKADGTTIFYPRGTRSNEMLALYAQIFDSIEVDSTFYAIPASSAVENWYKKTPANFTFSLKMPQQITHEYNLREPSFPLMEEFCDRVSLLREKLGAVLVQMPPNFEASKENAKGLREFLAELPKEIRFAVEFRNREWLVDWTFEELKKNSVALCLVEGSWLPRARMFEAVENKTANFAYIRFMGERDLTTFDRVVRPQDANLQTWKAEIERIEAEDIFVYFSNFYEGLAPESVNKLKKMFGHKTVEPGVLENQKSLF
jgi:uncharacterized protein YecE (DUF72 family)